VPGTFSYVVATNIASVIAGTSGSPADYPSFVTADRAGTGTFLKVASAPSKTYTLTYPVRPVEFRAIVTKFVVAAKTAHTDYLFITGTDAWDAAQTESIDVSAGNGTYTSTKRWRTISNISCSDAADGTGTLWADGTLAVTQDIWGVIWDKGGSQYQQDCILNIGDGSTYTYFKDTLKHISFKNLNLGVNYYITVTANASFLTGNVTDTTNKFTNSGCHFHFLGTSGYHRWLYCSNGSTVYIASSAASTAGARWAIYGGTSITAFGLWNSAFIGSIEPTILDLNVSNLLATANPSTSSYLLNGCTGTFDNITAIGYSNALIVGLVPGPVVYRNAKLLKMFWIAFGLTASCPAEVTALDCTADAWLISIDSTATGNFYRAYTCNVKVCDKNGTPIQTATVDCEYAHLVTGSDNKTYKCIADHTAVDATHKPITGTDWASYWVLHSTDGTLGGSWVTGFAYKAGTAVWGVGTVTTDATGNISEQNINYRRSYYSGAQLLETHIHKFTISKAGYQTLVLDNITVSSAIKWHKELQNPALKRWDGADWVQVGYRRWNGVAWV